jgi:replicative DNA helicase
MLTEKQIGKVPPQALDAEQSLLSASMLGAAQDIVELVSSDRFYRSAHQIIFAAIESMVGAKQTVDMISVIETLRASGKLDEAGGPSYISRITDEFPASISIKDHAGLVLRASQKRDIIRACSTTIEQCYNGAAVDDILGGHDTAINRIGSNLNECVRFSDFLSEHIELIEKRRESKGLPGIPSGLADVDRKFGGFQGSRLHVVAGRPGMGKTAFGMRVARGAAKAGFPVLQISLEMSKGQLLDRELSCAANVDGERIQNGDLQAEHWGRICEAAEEVSCLPLFVDDSPTCTIKECQATIRQFYRKHGRCLVIIDYLDYIRGNASERKDIEIGTITKGLKAAAKEHNIPVVLFVQLNRKCEERDDKRPEIRDLRNSGEIEQDADIIAFLYRDEVYNENSAHKGSAELIVRKYRQGKPGTVALAWIDSRTTFETLHRPAEVIDEGPKSELAKRCRQNAQH